jgi:hypothetical protein
MKLFDFCLSMFCLYILKPLQVPKGQDVYLTFAHWLSNEEDESYLTCPTLPWMMALDGLFPSRIRLTYPHNLTYESNFRVHPSENRFFRSLAPAESPFAKPAQKRANSMLPKYHYIYIYP